MAPERRGRRARIGRWSRAYQLRDNNNEEHMEETIAGNPVRHVLDSYCPYCATDIRAVGPRRLVRCPNTALCGKSLPLDDNCCPQCTHYTKPGDNFCRVCRTNLRGVVRVRGGLYQQLARVPSPLDNTSAPTQEPQPEGGSVTESEDDEQPEDLRRVAPAVPPRAAAPAAAGNNNAEAQAQMEAPVRRNVARRRIPRRQPLAPQAGFLRVVPMDDPE